MTRGTVMEIRANLGKIGRILILLGVVGAVASCAATYRNHGWAPSDDELKVVRVGVDTRDTVTQSIGAPSSTGVLDDGGFYYVESRVRNSGLRTPQIVSRDLVAIQFDGQGVVKNVERFGLKDGQFVRLNTRVTESTVSNNSIWRQLGGSLGRVSPGGGLAPSP
jgi:outer membrane protein assembly factor BamE (lipoprotein component of BamABCDE complex)